MNLDIITLIIVLSLIVTTQVAALFVQYKVNKTYIGIGYWLLASSFAALGFILLPFVTVKSLKSIAILANPLIILAHIYIYIGLKRFLNTRLRIWIPISIFALFNLVYYYYIYIDNNLIARTNIISITISIISFMIVFILFTEKNNSLSRTTNFTAVVFFIYGCFYTVRILLTSSLPSTLSYLDKGSTIISTLIISIIFSNLWTLGLILMVNHRLNIDVELEKEALVESEEKYRSILNASPDDITITDLNASIIMISPAAKKIFGYESDFDNFIGMKLLDFLIPEDIERARANILLMHKGKNENTNEYCAVRKDGSTFDIEVNSGFVYDINGFPDKMVFIIRDITKRKQIELEMQKLVHQLEIEKNIAQINSITDSLTGLFNRGYFDKTLGKEFSRLSRSGTMLSLIMLDIDHFKKFNDSYGHLSGDNCLQLIAKLLKDIVSREPDTVARFGGEEFIVILPGTDEHGAKILAERIRKGVEDLNIPHIASETYKYVTVSVGIITIFPNDLVSQDRALKLVDDALYLAKEQGRNRFVIAEISNI